MKKINRHLKIIFTAFSAGACFALTACVQSASRPQNSLPGYESEALTPFKDRLHMAVEKISMYDYREAEEILLGLADSLEEYKDNNTDLLRADTDYALGRTYSLLGNEDKSYEYYNSAYVWYRDILGESAALTADAALHLARYGEDKDLLRYAEIIMKSDADSVFKNIADCLSATAYISLDNKKEADKFLDKVNVIVGSAIDDSADSDSIERLYGESPEFSRTLGRYSLADEFVKAFDAKCDICNANLMWDEEINTLKEKLATLTGNDLKSEEEKASTLEILTTLTMIFTNTKEYDEYLKEALALHEKIYPVGSHLASVNVNIAEAYYIDGDDERFYEYLQKAKELNSMNLSDNNRTNALIHLRLADYYMLNSDYGSAAAEAESALDIYKNMILDNTSAIGAAYNILANAYSGKGDRAKIQETYDKAVETYKELGMDLERATSLRNRALITNNTFRDHTTAMKYAREAIAIVESLDHDFDSKTIAAIYMVMADITKPSDPEYAKIDEYAKKAYDCLQNAIGNTDQYVANYHYNYAGFLKDRGSFDEALKHYTEADKLFSVIYDEKWKCPVDVSFDMGLCLYSNKDYPAAREMFLAAIKYEEEAIKHDMKPEWCTYLENNRQTALSYINDIDRNHSSKS